MVFDLLHCLFLIVLVHNAYCATSKESKPPIVQCESTKGKFDIEIYPEWSPIGAQRFLELVVDGFFTDIALFRCVKRFLTQFGISDKPKYKHWHEDSVKDDPNLKKGIKKYYLSYAGGGPNTRSTQLFIAVSNDIFVYSLFKKIYKILIKSIVRRFGFLRKRTMGNTIW